MTIKYTRHYYGRDIFIIEEDNKYILVYRSSGRSGTGHYGDIIPFSSLNSEKRDWKTTPGYIYKEYWNGVHWKSHDKDFKGVQKQFLDKIKEFVKDTFPEKTIESDDYTRMGMYNFAAKINKEIQKILKDKELYVL